jgi:hypothetical protein
MTEEQPPSEQRGGTTPDEAEAREKGEWAGTGAGEGIVPAELGGSDAPSEMLDEDPEMHSGVLGRTTGSDEPATEDGIDLSAGDHADATTDGGSEPEPAALGRPRAPADRHRDSGRRPRALHLVPPGHARALSGGGGGRLRPRRTPGPVPVACRRDRRALARARPPALRIAAVDGDGAGAYARHRAELLSLAGQCGRSLAL